MEIVAEKRPKKACIKLTKLIEWTLPPILIEKTHSRGEADRVLVEPLIGDPDLSLFKIGLMTPPAEAEGGGGSDPPPMLVVIRRWWWSLLPGADADDSRPPPPSSLSSSSSEGGGVVNPTLLDPLAAPVDTPQPEAIPTRSGH